VQSRLTILKLLSDYTVTLADVNTLAAHDATVKEVRTERLRASENSATKAHLRAVLDVLAGRQADAALLKQIPNADKLRAARPEDLVLPSASSHGYTDRDGIFYLA
jgi:replication initiation and membrane attachment protein DnaB